MSELRWADDDARCESITSELMRVLITTRNFPPLVGGMERLIYHCYQALSELFRVDVVGPKGCQQYLSKESLSKGCATSPLPLFLSSNIAQTYLLARSAKPSLILSGSGLTSLSTYLVSRWLCAKSVCYVHGLDLVVDSHIYRHLFLRAIRNMDHVIANSSNTKQLAERIGVDSRRITIINPGIELPEKGVNTTRDFKHKCRLERKKIILSVGRLSPRKGLAEFIRFSLPKILAASPDTVFVVIGGEASDAAKSHHSEKERILSVARDMGIVEHVMLLGQVDDATLSQAYAESELLVFPVLDQTDDVEGFGIVAVEAAAHGLPTIAFAAGGIPDAVEQGVSGYLVTTEDYDSLTARIIDQLNMRTVVTDAGCREFASRFSLPHFSEKILTVVKQTVSG